MLGTLLVVITVYCVIHELYGNRYRKDFEESLYSQRHVFEVRFDETGKLALYEGRRKISHDQQSDSVGLNGLGRLPAMQAIIGHFSSSIDAANNTIRSTIEPMVRALKNDQGLTSWGGVGPTIGSASRAR